MKTRWLVFVEQQGKQVWWWLWTLQQRRTVVYILDDR